MNRFDPPSDLPLAGKVFYWVSFVLVMAAFSYFVLPLVAEYVSAPLAEFGTNAIFGPSPSAVP